MAVGDVRGLLQYVPLFRGRTFVVVFAEGLPESAVAETLLDLKALQVVGVQLVIGVLGREVEALADRATELEIKFARVAAGPSGWTGVGPVLKRGQAALLNCGSVNPLGAEMAALSRSVDAAKLIALVNGPGVLRGGKPLHAVARSAVSELAGEIEGVAMLQDAAVVCEAGVPRVHVLDGRRQGVLADELFSNEGVGTMVHADSYRELRPLREDDVPELLAMIGRSVRREHLVPRDYDEIVQKASDFLVLCVDGNVVGCVALHRYEQVGEVACLYVKQSHERLGHGRELVLTAEKKAVEDGMTSVFALTTRALEFFESLGYAKISMDRVPWDRRAKLEESDRNSVVLAKELAVP
ncbi:MAG: GNAT family N-acetyltransferase [Roseibacillus sp.]